jgi:hypothetical protein
MFGQMKELGQLSGDQREKAAHGIIEQNRLAMEDHHLKAQEKIEWAKLAAEKAKAGGAAAGKPIDEKALEQLSSLKDVPAQLRHVADIQK